MHVWIRADGGPSIGMGHLIRTRSLGNALLERGHSVTYLTRTPDHANSVLPDRADVRTDVAQTLTTHRVGTLLVDLPAESLDPEAELSTLETLQRYREAADTLVVLTDQTDATVCGDVVINPHIYAEKNSYEWVGPQPTWKLGGDYWIFEPEIRELANRTPAFRTTPERALVTMGGSDVSNVTATALRAFERTALHVDVVVGPGFSRSNRRTIDETIQDVDVPIQKHVDPDGLAELIFEADFAVGSLGFTAYELLALQTPFVGLQIAPDQRPKATALAERGAIVYVDENDVEPISDAVQRLAGDVDLRSRLRTRGSDIVDPDGVERVCDVIEETGSG